MPAFCWRRDRRSRTPRDEHHGPTLDALGLGRDHKPRYSVAELASRVLGVVFVFVIFRIVVWPQVRGWLASGGKLARARVISMELTSTRNEKKEYLHRAELEITPEQGAPYRVTVTEHVPWLRGGGESLDFVMVRVHPRRREWVTMVGPGSAEAFLREREK